MLTIIGCGNSNRSDDGAGVYVAQRLLEHLRNSPNENVKVFDAGTGGIDVMFRAKGAKQLVIIDAAVTNSPPGTIHKVPGEELISDKEPSYSLHDLRWDHALYAGRKIFRDAFPTDVTVFLIEAAELGLGLELTDAVRNAADKVCGHLLAAIDEYEPNKQKP